MNIPDPFFESLETIFWVKNTLILLCRSGSGIRNLFDPESGIRDGKKDPQHCNTGNHVTALSSSNPICFQKKKKTFPASVTCGFMYHSL
jgi:hypothetical protein